MLDLYVAVTSKKPKPRAVVHAAQSFRLSRDILERIGKGEKFDVKDIVARHKNAVSDGFVAVVLKAVDNAYHALGRGGVRSTWLSAAPLVFVAAAASALYEKAGLLPVDPKHAPVADWALAGAPVVLTWLLAGWVGLRGVRGVVGTKAARRPRQGAWPWLTGAFVLGLPWLTLKSPLDASMLRLPFAPPPSTLQAAQLEYLVRSMLLALPIEARIRIIRAAAAIGATLPDFAKEGLAPSGKPPLLPTTGVPESQMRGMPDSWRMQSALAQLGFYHGPLDGARATPAVNQALEAMLEAIPDYNTAHIREPLLETAMKALKGDIRLRLPADRTVAAGLGNIARGNLTADDLTRLGSATERAPHAVGKEQVWHSADGKRGGRVLVARLEPAAGPGCGRIYVEVEIGEALDSVGPQSGCFSLR